VPTQAQIKCLIIFGASVLQDKVITISNTISNTIFLIYIIIF